MADTSTKRLLTSLNINIDLASTLSYSSYQAECESKRWSANKKQNSFSFLHKIVLTNKSDKDILGASLVFKFLPSYVNIASIPLTCLEKGKATEVDSFQISLDVAPLYALSEAMPGSLEVALLDKDGNLLNQASKTLTILPIEQSADLRSVDEILSSFVTPNDQKVKALTGKAAQVLLEKHQNSSFAGYQYHDPNKVLEELDALYVALVNEGIRYSEPPASFEKTFQRVRLPYTSLKEKTATCLDFSLLYASMVEAVGLRPLLVIVEGHAFVGCWLDEDSFTLPKIDNQTELLNYASKGFNHLVLINVVDAASTPSLNFLQASENGYKALEEAKRFYFALDINSCRKEHLLPLPTPVSLEDGTISIPYPFSKDNKSYELPTIDVKERRYVDPSAPSSKNKFDYWEEKLLDLTMRNRLINLHFSQSSLQFVVSDADKMLSFLENNSKISLCPNTVDLNYEEKETHILSFAGSSYGPLIKEAEKKKALLVVSKEGNPEDVLKNLSRKGNTAIEESGCNPLFLTLGLIKWYDNEKAALHGTGAYYAPLFLLPVKMPRRKTGLFYTLEYSIEDLGLNTTILEYFKQVFHLDFSAIASNALPKKSDGSVDLRLIYNFIRQTITPMKGWALLEEPSTISLFSFARFVMWNDIKMHRDTMMKNPFVESLVNSTPSWKEPATQIKPEELDEKLYPTSLAIPLSADSSQIEAIEASNEGASFVLDGPPGTGKSQTIANMITNFLYHGKKVLFVAEKGVALEVVKKRLDQLGLGQFCLELPSLTTVKSDVLSSLGNLLDLGPIQGPLDFQEQAKKIEEEKTSLNQVLSKLHKKGPYFASPYEAIIGYLELSKYKGRYESEESYIKALTPATFSSAKEILNDLAAATDINGEYAHSPFLPFTHLTYNLEERDNCLKEAAPLVDELRDLHRDIYNCFFKDPGLMETRNNVEKYLQILSILRENPALFQDYLNDPVFLSLMPKEKEFLEKRLKIAQDKEKLLLAYEEGVCGLNASELKAKFEASKQQSLFKKERVYFDAKKSFKPFAKNRKSLSHKSLEEAIITLNEITTLEEELVQADGFVRHVFAGFDLSSSALCESRYEALCRSEKVINLLKEMTPAPTFSYDDLMRAIKRLANDSSLLYDKSHSTLLIDYQKIETLSKTLESKYGFVLSNYPDEVDYYGRVASSLGDAISSGGQYSEWVKLLNTLKQAEALIPSPLLDLYKKGSIKGSELLPSYLSSTYFKLLSIALAEEGLGTLSAQDTERAVAFYQKNMKEFASCSVVETASRISNSYPSSSVSYASSTKTYQLRKLAKNGGRGISLRRLFGEYSDLIKTLCPCFLMSPLAVAQYLDPTLYHFDAVIFDEASQIPTSEAIGAISRGNSVIIAGDQEQMPPTNFFTSNVGASLDEEASLASLDEDLESLLDDAIVLGLPRKRLNWHYRSHHESLIAYSNNKFYGNSLLTFPSPRKELASVSYHFVGGVYEKKRAVNRKEAQAVVAEIKRRLLDPVLSKESIGVVTFNEAQQNLIEDYLDKELSSFVAGGKKAGDEPIFVKNLENVQGDERDVILFSICYAPSSKGEDLSLNFGPLSREKGERRLNVAVSRAREEMMVFASIHPEDIKADRAKNAGAQYLRDFLDFSMHGVSSLANNASNQIVPSSISIADFLAKDLQKLGYHVKSDLGASSFKVDLAIEDPHDPDHFLLGIVCDGDSYCAPLTCRDRNIVQPTILNQLGWKIFRVWSVEYLDHPLEVLKNVVAAINGARVPMSEKSANTPLVFQKKEIISHPNAIRYVYKKSAVGSCDFSSPFALGKVINWLGDIIPNEYPLSRHLLEEHFRECFSLSKIGSTSRNILNMALAQYAPFVESCGSMDFYWPKGVNVEAYRFYRLNDGELTREISDISFIELGNAIADILQSQGRMSDVDLIKQVSLLFGFASLKEKSRVYLLKALKNNAGNRLGIVYQDGFVFIG